MAPRTAAALAAAAATFGIEQLPDELLIRCLGRLNAADRHRAALVSRRWHSCALSPELCREVSRHTCNEERLASLAAFLTRHGRHVHSLHLTASVKANTDEEAEVQLHACIAACSAHGQLRQLSVDWYGGEPLAMCPLPCSLRELDVHVDLYRDLHLGASMCSLTQLTKLLLSAGHIALAPAVQPPATIEWLHFAEQELPAQFFKPLTRLTSLVLSDLVVQPDGYAPLASLTSLRRLQLHQLCCLPDCLGELTWLECLALLTAAEMDVEEDAEAARSALNAALQPLTQLTSLCLDTPVGGQLPSLSRLSHLQRLYIGHTASLHSLPGGPWCGSLRELGAPWSCLENSGGALAAAQQLQNLAVVGDAAQPSAAFVQWAATHPQLLRFEVALHGEPELVAAVQETALQLKGTRPQLEIIEERICGWRFEKSFHLY